VSEDQGGSRLRNVLVTGQIMLSTLLLLGTGLLALGLNRALEGDLASTTTRVVVASLELPGRFVDQARGVRYRNAVLDQVPALPGVLAVGWAATLPLARGNRSLFQLEGKSADVADTLELESNIVSPGYFSALGLVCVEGRLLDPGDHALAPPVAVVDELLARRYLGAHAIGRHLVDARGVRHEIVGVVRTGTYRTLQPGLQPTVYLASAQAYLYRGHLLARIDGDPAAMIEPIRQSVKTAGEGGTVLRISTLDRHVSDALVLDRLTTTLVAACGLVALIMATIGVYGTMADAVRRRTKEIGLRVALGAGRVQVVRLVFVEAIGVAAAGLLAGTVAGLAIVQIVRAFFFAVPRVDLPIVSAVAGVLTAAVALAAIVPLRRALAVHPNTALRSE
jgi:hypothetical protein